MTKEEIQTIAKLLVHYDIDYVKQGLQLLSLLAESSEDIYTALSCQPTSMAQLLSGFQFMPHGVFIKIWLMGELTNRQVQWCVEAERLHLYQSNVAELPTNIDLLSNLREVSLILCQLSIVPPEIATWTNLHTLNLSGNQLCYLPKEIGQLQNLNKLFLGNNQFTVIPEEISCLPNLQHLNLSNNPISKIPHWIPKMSSLLSLTLQHTDICPEALETVRLQMPACTVIA